MSGGSRLVFELIHGISDPNSKLREEAAEAIVDVFRSLSDFETAILGAVLVIARTVETDPTCQEAQMNALAELHEWGRLPAETLDPLRALDRSTLVGSELEYWDELGL
jgi:hypothetical protein